MNPEEKKPNLFEIGSQHIEPLDEEAYALLYYKERNELPPIVRQPLVIASTTKGDEG